MPSGQDMSTVEVRRTEPGRRSGWRDRRDSREARSAATRANPLFANHVFILSTLSAAHLFRPLF